MTTTLTRPRPTKLQRLEVENERLQQQNQQLLGTVAYLEEELRVSRATQHAQARRVSYGTGYQQ